MTVRRYSIHSMFLTIQGEGANAGRLAVFVRFSGCNVWSGHEKDRDRDALANSPCAKICDTAFVGHDLNNGGGIFTKEELWGRITSLWPSSKGHILVVLTGGEPSLQLTEELMEFLIAGNVDIAVETNGSKVIPADVWITLSPKPPMLVVKQKYTEVKILYPIFDPLPYVGMAPIRWVQPVDFGPDNVCGTINAVNSCFKFIQDHPEWCLSVQGHKLLGLQ